MEDLAQHTAYFGPFSIDVLNVNDPPVISGLPLDRHFVGNEDSPFSFTPVWSDSDLATPNGDSVVFTLVNAPVWLSANPVTGGLSGMPLNEHVGTTGNIVLYISDISGATAALGPFSITVSNTNDPPVIGGSPPLTANTGVSYEFMPAAGDDDLIYGDAITFSISGSIPPWMHFDATAGTLTGAPRDSDSGATGLIEISVADRLGARASLPAFQVLVHVNHPPIILGVPPLSVRAGDYYRFEPTLSDPDGDATWFEITNLPSWANFSSVSGVLEGVAPNETGSRFGPIQIVGKDSVGHANALTAFSISVLAKAAAEVPLLSEEGAVVGPDASAELPLPFAQLPVLIGPGR